MKTPRRILLKAHAKINLGLLVLRKREDGFHDIETIFSEIDWHDLVEIHDAPGISMECTLPSLPADASNLCMKAAALLRGWTNYEGGAHIRLVKNIPVGSGLGGGSSDAAAVLTGLNLLWGTGVPAIDLARLGAQLGSDVPFFIVGGSAFGTGRGELLEHRPATLPYWILTVVPPLHISTAWAYGNLSPQEGSSARSLRALFEHLETPSTDHLSALVNDFEEPVFRSYPAIRQLKQELAESGSICSLMSGSGSSVFGLFADERDAQDAVSRFPVEYRTFLTPPHFHRGAIDPPLPA